jgi:crotonobetainyl-CoA:carnitine CoA-transferase CaiB-like acyl-CoA transferase
VENGEQIFLAAVSDAQFALFCEALGLADLKADTRLSNNNDRVRAREWLLPLLRARLAHHNATEISASFEARGLPFAPIARPQDLLDDPHLKASGGLVPITLPDGERAGQTIDTVLFPLTLDGKRPGVRLSPPKLGEHTQDLLTELGYTVPEIEQLRHEHIVL